MHFHRNASRDKYNGANEKSIKIHLDASHPYVPLPIATVSFVGSGNTRAAVERRDSSHVVVNHRKVATCRILSQSVVISRDAKKVEFYRPEAPSPFPL
jgi:hypothetical protein